MARLIINEIARKRGMNQSQLQLKAAVSPQLLNRYWNNRTRSVALDQLEKISNALDVKPGDLIISDEDTNKQPTVNVVAPLFSLKQRPQDTV